MREWHSPSVQLCCADLLGACGDTFGVHVAAPVVDETAVNFWGKRHWDEGWPQAAPPFICLLRCSSPTLSAPSGSQPCVPLGPS